MKVKVHPKRDQLVLRRVKRTSLVLPGGGDAGTIAVVEAIGPDAAYLELKGGERLMLGAGAGYGVDEDEDIIVIGASRVLAVIEELPDEERVLCS